MNDTKLTNAETNNIANVIREEANRKETNAGYAGEMGDRGASRLRSELECWICGLKNVIPPHWQEIVRKKQDPEWAEYQRLKKKFKR